MVELQVADNWVNFTAQSATGSRVTRTIRITRSTKFETMSCKPDSRVAYYEYKPFKYSVWLIVSYRYLILHNTFNVDAELH